MRLTDGTTITRSDPNRHKFADGMSEYLHALSMDGRQDEDCGDVECPTGWFARFGKRILFTDDRGFVWTENYDDSFGAGQVYDALVAYYCAWSHDDQDDGCDHEWSEWDESRLQSELDRASAYLAYVVQCALNACVAFTLDGWEVNGKPMGPLGGAS